MGIMDNSFNWEPAPGASLSGTADQLSSNVYDAGSAIKLFAGSGKRNLRTKGYVTAIGGTTPTFRARLVAADNAALTTNPIILDDTGVSRVLVAADLPYLFDLDANDQIDAKRFYGVIYTQSGTTPTATVVCGGGLEQADNLLK